MKQEFDTLNNYLTIAKKTIHNFGKSYYPALVREMLDSDEVISTVAHAIMVADWKWDNNRVGKVSGKSKSQYSFRNQHAVWAIKKYITKKYTAKSKRHKIINDYNLESISKYNLDPSTEYEQNDYNESLKNNIRDLIDFGPISDKQKDQIRMYYYQDMTLQEIGNHYGVTKEAVRLNIKKGIGAIREMVENAS